MTCFATAFKDVEKVNVQKCTVAPKTHDLVKCVLYFIRTTQCTKSRTTGAPNSTVQKHSRSLSLTDAAECVEVRLIYITGFSVCCFKDRGC